MRGAFLIVTVALLPSSQGEKIHELMRNFGDDQSPVEVSSFLFELDFSKEDFKNVPTPQWFNFSSSAIYNDALDSQYVKLEGIRSDGYGFEFTVDSYHASLEVFNMTFLNGCDGELVGQKCSVAFDVPDREWLLRTWNFPAMGGAIFSLNMTVRDDNETDVGQYTLGNWGGSAPAEDAEISLKITGYSSTRGCLEGLHGMVLEAPIYYTESENIYLESVTAKRHMETSCPKDWVYTVWLGDYVVSYN